MKRRRKIIFLVAISAIAAVGSILYSGRRAAVEAKLAAQHGIDAPAAWTFSNPVVNANFPDPGILKVGGTYYAFATNSKGRTVPVKTSMDLAQWSAASEALA